jgi:hypothetical protein
VIYIPHHRLLTLEVARSSAIGTTLDDSGKSPSPICMTHMMTPSLLYGNNHTGVNIDTHMMMAAFLLQVYYIIIP